MSEEEKPIFKCNVVIRKQAGDDAEVICPETAEVMTTIVNPDNQTQVVAIVLLCKRHNDVLEAGQELVILGSDHKTHYLIQQAPQEDMSNDADEPTPAPDGPRPRRSGRSKSDGGSRTRRPRSHSPAAGHAADPG